MLCLYAAGSAAGSFAVARQLITLDFHADRMVNGPRLQFAGFDTWVSSGNRHTIRAVAKGDRIVCYFDGKPVISASDKTYAKGNLGLWTRADSVIAFDELTITPLR